MTIEEMREYMWDAIVSYYWVDNCLYASLERPRIGTIERELQSEAMKHFETQGYIQYSSDKNYDEYVLTEAGIKKIESEAGI